MFDGATAAVQLAVKLPSVPVPPWPMNVPAAS
jgi:hypothetical protein